MTYLRLSNISKKYDKDILAVNDFSLNLDKGRILGMVGESGSGKSTLLKIIAGLETQSEGEVWVDGEKILNPTQKLVPGYKEIQLVHQDYRLYPNSTVEENIRRPLLLFDKSYAAERVKEMLSLLDLEKYKTKYPGQLSGGQQQKVAIGRALSMEPSMLLLDEPFSSLDSVQKQVLIEELREILESVKTTAVFVTHELDDALQLCDQICIIRGGRLVQKGGASQLFAKPKNKYVAKLFTALNPLPDRSDAYVRPSSVKLLKTRGLPATVLTKRFLTNHNLLIVQLKNSGLKWVVEDKERKLETGEKVYLKYAESNILHLK